MSFAIGWGLGCARVPPAEAPADPGEREASVVAQSTTGACDVDDFVDCIAVCQDRGCLSWCGGTVCAEVAGALYACAAPGDERFVTAHPEPERISRRAAAAGYGKQALHVEAIHEPFRALAPLAPVRGDREHPLGILFVVVINRHSLLLLYLWRSTTTFTL